MCRKTDFTFRGWLKMDRTKWKVLDRGMIKYIAMFTKRQTGIYRGDTMLETIPARYKISRIYGAYSHF